MSEKVIARMINKAGEESGTATFTQANNGVIMELKLYNMPAGEFAMHVHEVGLATAPDFTDAGGHFNPTGATHGIHSERGPHVGDLPNIKITESGEFEGLFVIAHTSLKEGDVNTLNNENGTTLIVHEGHDDYISQPTGDAGGRQLGGVIFAKK